MTEKEFFKEYENSLERYLTECKKILKEKSNLKYPQFISELMELSGKISAQSNLLISELMNKNAIDYNSKILVGTTYIPLPSYLLTMSFSIQSDLREEYDHFAEKIQLEILYRDFPSDCQEGNSKNGRLEHTNEKDQNGVI